MSRQFMFHKAANRAMRNPYLWLQLAFGALSGTDNLVVNAVGCAD